MLIQSFTHIIDIYIKELEHYNFMQLCAKPTPNSWSLGQMYMHLIADTTYYIEQIKICVASNADAAEEASADAKIMFLNNDFPDEALEGAPDNAYIPQPDSKEQLTNNLINIKVEMNKMVVLISGTLFKGKTKHPGHDYFSAKEWLQFAEMHFRHHVRQKKRIDDFLKINSDWFFD